MFTDIASNLPKVSREFNYDDIYLIPNRCVVDSRSECDTSVQLGKHRFEVPVVAANMKSVVDEGTCEYFAQRKWFYIMHRFGISLVDFYHRMDDQGFITSGSIGVNEDTYNQLKDLKYCGFEYDYLCLDVAHAHSPKCERMIKWVKDNFPNTFLIVGNVATAEATIQLEDWGADCIKAGISNGHVCETYRASGFGRPQVSTDLECCSVATKPVISDGAASCVGDICKSLAAGSTMKMIGSMFAGYEQSAGDVIHTTDGHMKKQYYGSASSTNKGEHKYVEGKTILVDYKGNMDILLYDIKAGISSGISYSGGKDLSAFNNVRIVYSTPRHW